MSGPGGQPRSVRRLTTAFLVLRGLIGRVGGAMVLAAGIVLVVREHLGGLAVIVLGAAVVLFSIKHLIRGVKPFRVA